MPLPEELKDDLKSTVADLANVSAQRFAGMLVAGVYLREFVADGVQWAHIDIAGPAYNTSGPWGYTRKGGTGVPTRTMFAVLEDIARQRLAATRRSSRGPCCATPAAPPARCRTGGRPRG